MRILLVLSCGLLLCACARDSADRILDFHADVEVHEDGGVSVTERIRVATTGQDIQRGIVREFPTLYRGRFMERIPTDFKLIEVQRDGRVEPSRVETVAGGVEIYIGSRSAFLDPGEYTYQIRYRSGRQVLHFDDHDELYWNVTGNGWIFPIARASVAVTLPAAVAPLEALAWTGPRGWRSTDAVIDTAQPGVVRVATTTPLSAGSGLTVAVAFPKGVVDSPTAAQARAFLWRHNGSLIVGWIGVGTLLLYYLVAWLAVGRDPRAGVIVPQYEPPPDLSPGAARYLVRMAHDEGCMVADLVDAAVQGRIRLEEKRGRFEIVSADPQRVLPSWQGALVDALVPAPGDRQRLEPGKGEAVRAARDRHEAALREHFTPTWFMSNGRLLTVGLVLAALTVLAAWVAPPHFSPLHLLFGSGWILLWSAFALGLAATAVTSLFGRQWLIAVFCVIVAPIPAAAAWFGGAEFLGPKVGFEGVLMVAVLLAATVAFAMLKARPTARGRAALDRIEGLALYLGLAEKDALAALAGPQIDDRRYQTLLPWAMALDVEEAWTRRFAAAAGDAAALRARSDSGWIRRSVGGAAMPGATLGAAFARSIASSVQRSASSGGSSRSGGGGRSGGGRGGGGGRGW